MISSAPPTDIPCRELDQPFEPFALVRGSVTRLKRSDLLQKP